MSELQTLHPDRERLTAFGLGRLTDEESRPIEQHLLDCTDCRQQVENLAGDSLVCLLQSSGADTFSDAPAAVPTAEEKSAAPPVPEPGSLPPLYKKLQGILTPKDEAPSPAAPAKESAPSTPAAGFVVPKELQGHSRYEVLAPLGAGGMGTVYKAQHRLMSRVVALKIVNPLLVNKPGAVERFEREVKAAAKLVHPNIVTAYDAEKVGDMRVLVMEFVEGETLAQVLNSRRELPVGTACEYIRQTAIGLQHALEHGMVHRDIKPQNLMVVASPDPSAPGVIKILDFGLARFVSEQHAVDEAAEQVAAMQVVVGRATKDGALMGSPDYLAPEQASDAHSADARADIYGMGCTLYHLLAGQVPFPVSSLIDKLIAHRDQQPIPLNHVRPDVPVALANVVAKMMAKDPGQRYQKAAEVAVALEPFSQMRSVPKIINAKSPNRRRVPWLAAAAVLLLVLGLVAYFGGSKGYRFATNQGVLFVDSDDENVEVVVKRNGEIITILDKKSGPTVTLPAGRYEIELVKGGQVFKAFTKVLELSRGGEEIVRLTRLDLQPQVVGNKPKKDDIQPLAVAKRRQLKDVIDLAKAPDANEEFSRDKKSVLARQGMERDKEGRLLFRDNDDQCWGDTVHTFKHDFMCEAKATVVAAPCNGWGIGINNFIPDQPEDRFHGVEVLLNSQGELHIVPSRFMPNEPAKIAPIGPIRVKNLETGEKPNALAVIVRGGRTLEIFVNGIETCDPITLKETLSPVHTQLAIVSGEKGSVLAFESFKVWSASFTWPADDLREGRIPAPDLSKAKVQHQDDFKKPNNGWPQGMEKNQFTWGYDKGRYFIQNHGGRHTGANSPWKVANFACELVGNVNSKDGSDRWGLAIAKDWDNMAAIRIMLDGKGGLEVAPGLEEWGPFPGLPAGNIRHPAIKKGDAFNALLVVLRGRRLEVYVNGLAVCDPITLDRDITPGMPGLELFSQGPARAEFERITIWDAKGLATPEERLAKMKAIEKK